MIDTLIIAVIGYVTIALAGIWHGKRRFHAGLAGLAASALAESHRELTSEVEQLRTLVQTLKFHTDENAKLGDLCVEQAERIADLNAALNITDRPRAIPPRHRWRSSPPTPDEVSAQMWWWNKPADGVPHILQLDRDLGSGLIFDAGDASSCPPPFDPSDWPGEWAPCMTPDDVTFRVSRIAEAGKRLVRSHVDKVCALRAQLAERPTLTFDEVRAVVREIALEESQGFPLHRDWSAPLACGIADRVAKKLGS